jgi:predicted Zn-dependent protease
MAAATALVLLASCAINPATGKRQTMFISEETEFKIGKQADEQIRKEYGVYLEKPELRSYVASIGGKLARRSDRPNIQYHFEVVDSPIVNAFALPGGFIYITRGILERMNSEDELAAVMGHEIAHVAARHGAAQISKAYLAQAGLIALSILGNPESAAAIGDLANLAVGLALQGYSREYERQADDFGFQYAKAAGYNPKGSIDLLQTLARLSDDEPSSVEAFFSSHPRTSERIRNAKDDVSMIRQRNPNKIRAPRIRDPYIVQLDGMAVGVWNGHTLIRGNRLYDKQYALAMDVPDGFTANLQGGPTIAVFEQAKAGLQAAIGIEPLPKRTRAEELAQTYRKESKGLRLVSERPRPGTRLPMHEMVFEAKGKGGQPLELWKGFAVHDGFSVTLTVVSPAEQTDPARAAFGKMADSLEPLSTAEVADVQPPRLRIHRISQGETWRSLGGGGETEAERLAAYNGFSPEEPPPYGQLIKLPPSLATE